MSTDGTTTELPLPPDWNQTDDEWHKEVKQQLFGLYLGHQGMMLDKVQRQNAIVEATARFAATGDSAQLAKEIAPQAVEDAEVGVSIGNKEYHVHNYPSPPVTNTTTTNTTTQAAPEATPAAAPAGSSTLVKAASIAALLASGGVGTAGLNVLWNYLTQPAAPTTVIQGDTDTNAGLRFED